ncbi:MAG: phage tail assembly protein [Thiobacillus sp.]|nr:phage tail assembly protein [Thiobacillus sp.]
MTERIPLTYPIDHDGLPINEIALRRPTVGDHLAAQKAASSDAEREIRLMANLAELPPAAIHQLDMKDYAALQKVLGGFLS